MSDLSDFKINRTVIEDYYGSEAYVVIPDGITAIGDKAFAYSNDMYSITIPDSVTSIGDKAFIFCPNLESVTIPKSVTSIGNGVFNGCGRLSEFNVDKNNTEFSSCDGVLFNKKKTVLKEYPEGKRGREYSIPEGVKIIGDGAFYNCLGLYNITIPASVTSINEGAFNCCARLTSMTIPDSVTTIGDMAFWRCRGLTSIIIPEGVTSIGNMAFQGCRKLTAITLPGSLISIGRHLLKNSENVKTIVLPKNVKSFKGSALEVIWESFYETEHKGCMVTSFFTQLYDMVLGDSALYRKIKANKNIIMDYAIENDEAEIAQKLFDLFKKIKLDELNGYMQRAESTKSLKAFLLDYTNKQYPPQKREKYETDKQDKELGLKEYTLAEWKKIYAFDKVDENITIKSYKGKELDVFIPDKIGPYKVTAVGEYAFSPEASRIQKAVCEARGALQKVTLPVGVTSIGKGAFYSCCNLSEITIPDSVTYIGNSAFVRCESVAEILLPKGITSIGDDTFFFCLALKSVIIPDNVKSIGNSAFQCCLRLTSITIPDSVKSIGENAFNGCINLDTIKIPASVTGIGDNTFGFCKKLTIYAPKGSYAEEYAKEKGINFIEG